MKKLWTMIAVVFILPHFAHGGGIFVNSQQSAEYIRVLSRNAATDNADIAYYNMGGATFLEDGNYLNGSNVFFLQEATVKTEDNDYIGSKTYKSDNPFPIFPNFFYINKKDDRAFFCTYQTIGATAVRKWEKGLPTLDYVGVTLVPVAENPLLFNQGTPSSYLEGESAYYCFRGGYAKKINDIFAFGISARFVYTSQKVKGWVANDLTTKKLIIDAEDKGHGFSMSLNLNIRPVDKINIGLTYEHSTKIELETDVKDRDNEDEFFLPIFGAEPIFKDGNKGRLDLPQILRMGVSYQITDRLSASTSFNIYFEDNVNFSYLDNDFIDYKEAYSNTYELSAGIEYICSDKLLLSYGIGGNWIGQDKDYTTDASVPGAHSDYIITGAGGQYAIKDNLLVNFGLAYLGFIDSYKNTDTITPGISKEYDKNYMLFALGINYRF